MKHILIHTLCLIFGLVPLTNIHSQVAISSEGNAPDSSAMLDVRSTSKGLLVPRMPTILRNAINNPATGLLVFDTDYTEFYFYTGMAWEKVNTQEISSLIADADSDTKIQVEESPDDDRVRIDLAGDEVLAIRKNASGRTLFELRDSNYSINIGYQAGSLSTSGEYNTFLGYFAGRNSTSSYNNTSIGSYTMQALSTGIANVAIGTYAGFYTSTGEFNTFIGERAGNNNISGVRNTYLGRGAGGNALGSRNIFIGFEAGRDETGNHKLYIQNNASDSANTLIYGEFDNDWVRIGGHLTPADGIADADNDTKMQVEESGDEDKIRFDVGGTEAMIIDSSGYVGIGTNLPLLQLHVRDTAQDVGILLDAPNDAAFAGMAFLNGGAITGDIGHNGSMHALNPNAMILNNYLNSPTLFFTNNTERMRISGDGLVGIGTQTPQHPLHIVSDSAVQVLIEPASLEINQATTLVLKGAGDCFGCESSSLLFENYDDDYGNTRPFGKISGVIEDVAINDGHLAFYGFDGTNYKKAMFIDEHGTVNVGTYGATGSLEINGTLSFEDGNEANGFVLTSDNNGNASWQSLPTSIILADTDADTKIQVEQSADEDKIRFYVGGHEVLRIDTTSLYAIGRLDMGENIVIGEGAADSLDDISGNNIVIGAWAGTYLQDDGNTILGGSAGRNTTGGNNTFVGYRTGEFNEGAGNVFIGSNAGRYASGSHRLYIENSNADSTQALIYGEFDNNILQFNAHTGINVLNDNVTLAVRAAVDDPFVFLVEDTLGANFFVVRNTGKVGIGTNAPDYKFDIRHEEDAMNTTHDHVYTPGLAQVLVRNSNTNGSSTGIGFQSSTEHEEVGAAIVFERTASKTRGNLHFATRDDSSNDLDSIPVRMTITSAGNVGIGTTSPDARLNILDNTRTDLTLQILDNNTEQGIAFQNSGSAYSWNLYRTPNGNNTSDLRFAGNAVGSAESDITDLNNYVTFQAGGNVGIGTITPNYLLEVDGTAAKPGGGSWANSSDRRLKQNIKDYSDGLEQVMAIRPVTFQYNALSGFDTIPEYVGVIAQELQKIAPYMVGSYEKEGTEYLNVDPSAMTFMLINAIQEQQEQNADLQAEVDLLKTQVADLMQLVNVQTIQHQVSASISNK